MRPTAILMEEHRQIKQMLDVLAKACDKLEAGEDLPAEHLEQMLEFIRGFADRYHHAKEEDLLFPAMEETGIPRDGGPTGVMLAEHELGRHFVKAMAEGIEEYKKGSKRAWEDITENARNYIALLSQHIDKEDNILYVMADMHIPEDGQRRLAAEFEKVEKEKFTPGQAQHFTQVLEHLKVLYLQ